jgi:protein-tyrosine phosphatase
MIDIHCHPLSGVDDGARSFEVSVEMCHQAAADGITHLVATPHCNYEYTFDAELNQKKVEELQAAVGDSPKLLLGSDFHLSYDNIRLLIEDYKRFTINGTDYLLVEFGDQFVPDQMDRVFYDMQCTNVQPILTHPERNPVFQQHPDLLYHWVSRGCLVQVTAMSFTGGFGKRVLHFAETWFDQNLISFFASDAHDAKHRPPILSECYQKVRESRGVEIADLLLKRNPQAVTEGKPLPPGLEPVDPKNARKTRSWFSFLRR